MTPKEKAKELIESYKNYVNGYVGISMLINYQYPKEILDNARRCALITVQEIIKANPIIPMYAMLESEAIDAAIEYWREVEKEIINY